MSMESLKQEYVPKYLAGGEQKFYRFLILLALNKIVLMEKGLSRGSGPELEFLDYHDRFLILFRREGEEAYLQMAKIFRRAAHKIYRVMLRKNMTVTNAKFLNLV